MQRPIHRWSPVLLLPVLLVPLLLPGCAQQTEDDWYEPVVGTRLLMVSMIDPAADLLWDSVRTVLDLEGVHEFRPQTEEEWTLVRNAAITLAESGNLLMMGRRAVDQGNWIGWCQRLIDAGDTAMRAAEARDVDAIFDVGEEVYNACAGCHAQYWTDNASLPE